MYVIFLHRIANKLMKIDNMYHLYTTTKNNNHKCVILDFIYKKKQN